MALGSRTLRSGRTTSTIVFVEPELNDVIAISILSGTPSSIGVAGGTSDGLSLPLYDKTGGGETLVGSGLPTAILLDWAKYLV